MQRPTVLLSNVNSALQCSDDEVQRELYAQEVQH